ncbi:calcineurin-like phosphoesterase [Mycena rebaudengoi]|nr:calcineurin-like phosphoesterase [Mycena rebaudengoi]
MSISARHFGISSSHTVRNPFASSLPDFSRYAPHRTLSKEEFPLDDKRLIIVGDVHGMHEPFQTLLTKLSYDPSSDVLLHVGDIVAKGPHDGSLAVLSFMASNNITGVRGNHDQKVIEWRGWLEWIQGLRGGAAWLHDLHAQWLEAEARGADDPEAWAAHLMRKDKAKANRRWWARVPAGWKVLSDHYRIAHAMAPAEYAYMLALPLVLHAPAAHTYLAHAGLLASDPRYQPDHRRQPLARVPRLPAGVTYDAARPNATRDLLRGLQEAAVLAEVPQNNDPWVTLNMRGVLDDHSVTRKKDGEPWSDVWNRDLSLCAGFDQHMHRARRSKNTLPCYPSTVIYGHSASRGLDVKRWSIGLDSGCVYEKRFSSLVLKPSSKSFADDDDDERVEAEMRRKTIPFGDNRKAHVISVSCG